jgi:hypothetical protein
VDRWIACSDIALHLHDEVRDAIDIVGGETLVRPARYPCSGRVVIPRRGATPLDSWASRWRSQSEMAA